METKPIIDIKAQKILDIEANVREFYTEVTQYFRGIYKTYEYGRILIPFLLLKKELGQDFLKINYSTLEEIVMHTLDTSTQDIVNDAEVQQKIIDFEKRGILQNILESIDKLDFKDYAKGDILEFFKYFTYKTIESFDTDNGEFYTPFEVTYLISRLLIDTTRDNTNVKIYEPTCGVGWLLHGVNDLFGNDAMLYGQEVNKEAFLHCKIGMNFIGIDYSNIFLGNTLIDDKLKDHKDFDYAIANPPFGISWKSEQPSIEQELKESNNRFTLGLPPSSDSQLLFMQICLNKLNDTGRLASIHNGSVLFTGDAGSGSSECRKYIVENDLLEAIVQLPTGIFYNTSIPTYVFILNKNKPAHRKGKIQLIDASKHSEKMRKPQGCKTQEMTKKQMDEVLYIYDSFIECENSKIYDNEEFIYKSITVEFPKLDDNGEPILKKGQMVPDSEKRSIENIKVNEEFDESELEDDKAWIDHSKTKIGCEIPFTRYFYTCEKPPKTENLGTEIMQIMKEVDKFTMSIFN